MSSSIAPILKSTAVKSVCSVWQEAVASSLPAKVAEAALVTLPAPAVVVTGETPRVVFSVEK